MVLATSADPAHYGGIVLFHVHFKRSPPVLQRPRGGGAGRGRTPGMPSAPGGRGWSSRPLTASQRPQGWRRSCSPGPVLIYVLERWSSWYKIQKEQERRPESPLWRVCVQVLAVQMTAGHTLGALVSLPAHWRLGRSACSTGVGLVLLPCGRAHVPPARGIQCVSNIRPTRWPGREHPCVHV